MDELCSSGRLDKVDWARMSTDFRAIEDRIEVKRLPQAYNGALRQ